MDNSLPRWAEVLGSDPELRKSFNDWVVQRTVLYSREATVHSRDMSEVLGYRFLVGELEALVSMVGWQVEENARRQHAVQEVVGAESGKRRRRKRAN